MSANEDDLIFDINEIFKTKNQEEENVNQLPLQNVKQASEKIKIISSDSLDNKNIPEEKKGKKKTNVAPIIFLVFFLIEIAFTAFMIYHLYFVFNRPSREIDLTSSKYNNTLSFFSMSSNLGTINGTSLELFHNINIDNRTSFIRLSKIATFYPNGTITNNSFRVNSLYTDKIIFKDTNILGRGDFRDNIDFNGISVSPLSDFNAVEIVVGNFRITSNGVEKDGAIFEFKTECEKTNLQLLEMENLNFGEIIGQHNRKLVILKDHKIFLRAHDEDDTEIFDFKDEKYDGVSFVDYVARNDEMGIILKEQNGNIKIFNSNKLAKFPNGITSASLFQNKSLIYCTNDCLEIKIIPNVDKPEKSIKLLSNPQKSKFLAGRLYGGKIIIAAPDLNNNDVNQNVFIFKIENPVDITTYGKMAIITNYEPKENKFNFWLFKNNKIKHIKSVQASTAKASFIHFNSIIIVYSIQEKGTFYLQYDIFNDQLNSEINVSNDYFESFYISHELLALFGNTKDSKFSLLEKFTI